MSTTNFTSSTMDEKKIIFLWCHPRSTSTAFLRTFMQREDFIVEDEPFEYSYFFGPERLSNRYSEKYCDQDKYGKETFANTVEKILKMETSGKKIFIKDMPKHIIRPDYLLHPDNPTLLPLHFIKACTHTFLIRTPEKSISSYYRCYSSGQCPGYDHFDPTEAGYWQLQIMYEFLTNTNNGSRPLLIESDDLLRDPKSMMIKYCDGIQEEFDPKMLHWKPLTLEELKDSQGFNDAVQSSTEFKEIQHEYIPYPNVRPARYVQRNISSRQTESDNVEFGHRNLDIGIWTMSNFHLNFDKCPIEPRIGQNCRNSSGITTISIFADDFIVQYPMEIGQYTP
ncbi:unnamed protein product [Rotaria magnacalcarata]|uniref:Sulfotransferase n=1 Tax=Rotaria magnacalcarata TaxID=392030 RepID=A0A820D7U9_9BILA|nr:unnamed protein product [Rotaria magnacalcarata]CAF3836676.1 unnamed protein product [Rotaria magnacalcarata]CAF4173139.1 unnamed protein product [Rotaria magnacalcarata]CAF4228657.1 unnamed protein product [Rotaria magnacalcarata]